MQFYGTKTKFWTYYIIWSLILNCIHWLLPQLWLSLPRRQFLGRLASSFSSPTNRYKLELIHKYNMPVLHVDTVQFRGSWQAQTWCGVLHFASGLLQYILCICSLNIFKSYILCLLHESIIILTIYTCTVKHVLYF